MRSVGPALPTAPCAAYCHSPERGVVHGMFEHGEQFDILGRGPGDEADAVETADEGRRGKPSGTAPAWGRLRRSGVTPPASARGSRRRAR